jgi:hypothetical protein
MPSYEGRALIDGTAILYVVAGVLLVVGLIPVGRPNPKTADKDASVFDDRFVRQEGPGGGRQTRWPPNCDIAQTGPLPEIRFEECGRIHLGERVLRVQFTLD